MLKSKRLPWLFLVILNVCYSQKPVDFKEGRFDFYIGDSLSLFIERKGGHQLEYFHGINEDGKLSILNWQNDSLYTLKSVVDKDFLDTKKLYVKIDSVKFNIQYLNAYKESIDFNLRCRLVKKSNDLSEKFLKMIAERKD